MFATILALLSKLLGIFFPDKSVEATAEKTGEDAGKAKEDAANAVGAVKEIQGAVAAGNVEAAAIAADPGKLHDPANPASRPYVPGSVE